MLDMASTATTARRPRIPADIAEKIDRICAEWDYTFEEYVRSVLKRHVDKVYPDREAPDDGSRRVHEFHDDRGAYCWIDALKGGWSTDNIEGVVAGLAVDDEGYDSVGVYLDRAAIRGLRDACTELLEQTEVKGGPPATIHPIK